jgi:hypothetical protein
VIPRRTLSTNFENQEGTSKNIVPVPLFDLKFPRRSGREWCRNFRSAALVAQ